jgi:Raf kinase inhibitor-like YbhB/YbcL family protein
MEQKIKSIFLLLILSEILFLNYSCEKKSQDSESNIFSLTSPEISSDSLLPAAYTCDGESATLPLEWSGYPEGTKCFALIMHHEASPQDIHWYWVIYNIPLSVTGFPKNANTMGTLGNNSVNGKTEYAPPCSQGPGPKKYVYTIYALSDSVNLSVPSSEVNREVLLNAIEDLIIGSATLTVIYSRDI